MFITFIRRPIFSLVISLLILLIGILALFNLPISQFPDIAPPCVTVTAKYVGANSEVCTKAVATPLERAINGVPGMTYMSSVISNNGITTIQIYFKTGTDPDLAAVNVQNRVSTVIDELPEEVIKAGISTEKEVNSMLMYLNIYSEDSSNGEKFVYNFADINILQELKRIDGVGFCELMGSREYSMRVWLKPDRLTAYKLSPEDITNAIRRQNIEAAPGKTGESSGKENQTQQYVLKYSGKFNQEAQYKNLIIKSNPNGSSLRLKDVADIEFGSMDYGMVSKTNGKPSASIMIKQRPGSNAKKVIEDIKERMEVLKNTSFPPGMTYLISYDISRSLDASIHEVIKTLIEAFILVFLIVYIFLQDIRSTLIPALAVPVSLIGTFFFMQLLGFSINLLTLFALVLSIGIVVDNAIVIVEAVHAAMQSKKLSAKEATIYTIKDMSKAIIAITLVMAAVFVPVAFMSGPVGIFYKQFSLTLAFAIIISGINALTLTPALCAILLKNNHSTSRNLISRFFSSFNFIYSKTESKYVKLLSFFLSKKKLCISLIFIFIALTVFINRVIPSGFIPVEDQGMIYLSVTTPPGATVERTSKVLDQIQNLTKGMKSVESVSTLAGFSFLTDAAGASYGMGMINLKAWNDRNESAEELIKLLKEKAKIIKDAEIEFFSPPTVPGFGNASGVELRILNKNKSNSLEQTALTVNEFLHDLTRHPEINSAFTSFDVSFPQYMIHIDQDIASQKGVSIENAMNTLQTYIGSYYASNFIRFGQMYKVMVQSDPEYRKKPEDILKLYIKNEEGEMVSFSSFARLEKVYGPEQLTRYNMYTSAMVNALPNTSFSTGDVIRVIEKEAKENLPKGYAIEWSGMTREEIISGNQSIYIFIIVLLFVYLLLAAQYESLILPAAVILSLPPGIFGSLLALKLLGLENNIYAQVALVMLLGLLGKNAILIIEYAIQKKKEGLTFTQAAIDGAAARLRPILMTSFAFVAGLIPLCMATGAGAQGNKSIGTAAAGGMLIGTIFGVILIPALYLVFGMLENRLTSKNKNPKLENVEF